MAFPLIAAGVMAAGGLGSTLLYTASKALPLRGLFYGGCAYGAMQYLKSHPEAQQQLKELFGPTLKAIMEWLFAPRGTSAGVSTGLSIDENNLMAMLKEQPELQHQLQSLSGLSEDEFKVKLQSDVFGPLQQVCGLNLDPAVASMKMDGFLKDLNQDFADMTQDRVMIGDGYWISKSDFGQLGIEEGETLEGFETSYDEKTGQLTLKSADQELGPFHCVTNNDVFNRNLEKAYPQLKELREKKAKLGGGEKVAGLNSEDTDRLAFLVQNCTSEQLEEYHQNFQEFFNRLAEKSPELFEGKDLSKAEDVQSILSHESAKNLLDADASFAPSINYLMDGLRQVGLLQDAKHTKAAQAGEEILTQNLAQQSAPQKQVAQR